MNTVGLQLKLMQCEDRIHDFVDRHVPDRLKSTIPVDDVLQEVWTAAFRQSKDLREEIPEAFDRWIITIARNKVTDAIRHERAKRRGAAFVRQGQAESSFFALAERVTGRQRTPSSEEAAHESIRAVRVALGALPMDYRQAILLHHIEGRSHEEVARLMNRTPDAVNGLMFRGLRRLRVEMGRASRYFSDQSDTIMALGSRTQRNGES